MDENSGNSKRRNEKTFGEIKSEIDAKYPTLVDRAEYVMLLLQTEHPKLTTWDITCFCVGFLGLQCVEWEWLQSVFKPLAHRISVAHYTMDESGLVTEVQRGTLSRDSTKVQD
jgi:hypothetical protein